MWHKAALISCCRFWIVLLDTHCSMLTKLSERGKTISESPKSRLCISEDTQPVSYMLARAYWWMTLPVCGTLSLTGVWKVFKRPWKCVLWKHYDGLQYFCNTMNFYLNSIFSQRFLKKLLLSRILERGRHGERSFICWFIRQMVKNFMSGPGHNQEPETPPRSIVVVARDSVLVCHLLIVQEH